MTVASQERRASQRPVRLEILAYAPTEFFHCQHCEVVWNQIGLGQRFRAEQRRSEQLPPDLQAEYHAISDWVLDTAERFGARLEVRLVDAASIEGFWKALRHRLRRFPAFIVDDSERVLGFDRKRLEAELEARLGSAPPAPAAGT